MEPRTWTANRRRWPIAGHSSTSCSRSPRSTWWWPWRIGSSKCFVRFLVEKSFCKLCSAKFDSAVSKLSIAFAKFLQSIAFPWPNASINHNLDLFSPFETPGRIWAREVCTRTTRRCGWKWSPAGSLSASISGLWSLRWSWPIVISVVKRWKPRFVALLQVDFTVAVDFSCQP